MNDVSCPVVLLADRAWREDNGKLGLAGIFEVFNLSAFPAQVAPFFVFLRLTDLGAGKHNTVVNVISERTHAMLASVTLEFESPIPQKVGSLNIPLPPLVFPEPGQYAVHVSVNGTQVAKHVFEAVLLGPVL